MNPKGISLRKRSQIQRLPPQPILNQYLWEVALSSLFPGDVHARDFKPHMSSSLQAFIYLRPYWPTDLTAGSQKQTAEKGKKPKEDKMHACGDVTAKT